jgi:hypothetical protein
LVGSIPAPRSDHCQDEKAARAKQLLISAGVAVADLFRNMSQVELDRSMATRLKIYEQRPTLRVEEISRVWLSVQKLLGGRALTNRASLAS